jgi:ribosomal protein S12 methylthiotransferase accessory factor YcaO
MASSIKSAITIRLIAGNTDQTYTPTEVAVLVAEVADEQTARFAATLDTERARHAALVEAAQAVVAKNALIWNDPNFKGEWIAIPIANYLALRAALDGEK